MFEKIGGMCSNLLHLEGHICENIPPSEVAAVHLPSTFAQFHDRSRFKMSLITNLGFQNEGFSLGVKESVKI